jgi:hypothetical protein
MSQAWQGQDTRTQQVEGTTNYRRSLKPDFLSDLFTDGTQLMDVRDGIVSD